MGTDNESKKPFNYRAAKCVLHCNNCITLALALVLLINGILTTKGTEDNVVLKFTLCSRLANVADTNDLLHLHANQTVAKSGSPVVDGLAALCRPSGTSGEAGHCNPWKQDGAKRHGDCESGYYCDVDFVCWDCDYVTPSEDHPEKSCDAYDHDDPKYDDYTAEEMVSKGPCARCYDLVTNPTDLQGKDHTEIRSVAAPEGASFLGWPSDLSIGFGIVVVISSIFGFLGDAYKRRTLLFIHHFVLLLLGISMIYAVVACLAFRDYMKDMVRTYWPWVRYNFPEGMMMHDAQELMRDYLGRVSVLCLMTTMSLWSGVVASGRLLGLRLLAKQMLVMTNALTLIFSMALAITALVAYFSGYAATTVLAIWLLGALSAGVGGLGFIGAATERAGFLRAQMYFTVPLVLLLLIGALEALFWDKLELQQKAKAMAGQLGEVAPNEAVQMLKVHFVFVGLMALMLMVLVLLNLCCTRILLQRLSVDGRYYERVSVVDEDLEDDYGNSNDNASNARRRNDGGGSAHNLEMFEIGDEEDQPSSSAAGRAGQGRGQGGSEGQGP